MGDIEAEHLDEEGDFFGLRLAALVRRQAIAVGVVTALRGTCLTVTVLGRSIESTAKEKHCIKRADRLLANHDVPTESFGAYVALGHRLIGGTTRALIVVDWSDLDATKTHGYCWRTLTHYISIP